MHRAACTVGGKTLRSSAWEMLGSLGECHIEPFCRLRCMHGQHDRTHWYPQTSLWQDVPMPNTVNTQIPRHCRPCPLRLMHPCSTCAAGRDQTTRNTPSVRGPRSQRRSRAGRASHTDLRVSLGETRMSDTHFGVHGPPSATMQQAGPPCAAHRAMAFA